MKIAINQLLPIANDPETNFRTLAETVKDNQLSGAKLSVFPEDYLYGVLRHNNDLTTAGKQYEAWVEKFRDLAIKYNIDIIPGSFPQYKNGKIYNSTVYINAHGEVLTKYSKCNLWLAEREEYTPSLERPQVFDSVLGKTAIIICWDILDHELFRSAVSKGAEWIICLSFWSTNQSEDMARKRGRIHKEHWRYSDSLFLTDLVPTRSVEYGINMIFVNFGGIHTYTGMTGKPQQSRSAGRSQITTPRRQQYHVIRHRKPETLLADLNLPLSAKEFNDAEIGYGRHEDVVNNYPYGNK